MRKLLVTAATLVVAAVLGSTGADRADAAQAAAFSQIPQLPATSGLPLQKVDYYRFSRWYNGCRRRHYCKYREWVCRSYRYGHGSNCHWRYSGCYWGSCYGGRHHGGYGGHRGGGGY